MVIPYGCSNLHHEIELGVVISQRGSNIQSSDVDNYEKISRFFLNHSKHTAIIV